MGGGIGLSGRRGGGVAVWWGGGWRCGMNRVQRIVAVGWRASVVVGAVLFWGSGVAGQFVDPLGRAVEEAREGTERSRSNGNGSNGAASASEGEAGRNGGASGDAAALGGVSEEMRVMRVLEGLLAAPVAGASEVEVRGRLDRLVEESGNMAGRLDAGPLKQAVLAVRIQALYAQVTRWAGDPLNESRLAEMRRNARQVVACRGSDSAAVGDYWLMTAELIEINGQEGLSAAERRRLAVREMNRYLERYRGGPATGAVRDAVFALNARIERDRAAELRAGRLNVEERVTDEGRRADDAPVQGSDVEGVDEAGDEEVEETRNPNPETRNGEAGVESREGSAGVSGDGTSDGR